VKNLKIDLSELSADGKWYDFESKEIVEQPSENGVFLKIRPRPNSKANIVYRDGEMVFSGEDSKKDFIYCLEKWKGVDGSDDKPLPCTREVKAMLFDFSDDPEVNGMKNMVVGIGRRFHEEKEDLEKN